MTRESAIAELEQYIITSISTDARKHININVAKRIITGIFDNMETRICANCVYYKNSRCTNLDNDAMLDPHNIMRYGPIVANNFGCIRFERIKG